MAAAPPRRDQPDHGAELAATDHVPGPARFAAAWHRPVAEPAKERVARGPIGTWDRPRIEGGRTLAPRGRSGTARGDAHLGEGLPDHVMSLGRDIAPGATRRVAEAHHAGPPSARRVHQRPGEGARRRIPARWSRVARICGDTGIEHRQTGPDPPWSEDEPPTVRGPVGPTNGRVCRDGRLDRRASSSVVVTRRHGTRAVTVTAIAAATGDLSRTGTMPGDNGANDVLRTGLAAGDVLHPRAPPSTISRVLTDLAAPGPKDPMLPPLSVDVIDRRPARPPSGGAVCR